MEQIANPFINIGMIGRVDLYARTHARTHAHILAHTLARSLAISYMSKYSMSLFSTTSFGVIAAGSMQVYDTARKPSLAPVGDAPQCTKSDLQRITVPIFLNK